MKIEKIKDGIYKVIDNNNSYQLEAISKVDAETKYNNLLITDKKRNLLAEVQKLASKLLSETDYKVLRHLGQKELSAKGKIAKTKLTDIEYENLELEREAIREWSNTKEVEINSSTTLIELNNINTGY